MEKESLREIYNLTARKKMMDQRMWHSLSTQLKNLKKWIY